MNSDRTCTEIRDRYSLCYTGYQSDRIAEIYYAQAREYRAELGRFAGVDIIKGFAAAPYTLNEYGYCWGNPMVLVDLNGRSPKKIKGKDTEDEIAYSTEISYDEPTVTFCVEAPDKGSRNAIASGMEVGHTFIIIDYGNGETYARGFYPEEGLTVKQIILREDVSGVVYNESITYQITKEEADQLFKFANNYDEKYNMVNNNCTTFSVETLKSIGIDVPTTEHTWTLPDNIDKITGYPKWLINLIGGYGIKGYSPADVAMDIKEFKEGCGLD